MLCQTVGCVKLPAVRNVFILCFVFFSYASFTLCCEARATQQHTHPLHTQSFKKPCRLNARLQLHINSAKGVSFKQNFYRHLVLFFYIIVPCSLSSMHFFFFFFFFFFFLLQLFFFVRLFFFFFFLQQIFF